MVGKTVDFRYNDFFLSRPRCSCSTCDLARAYINQFFSITKTEENKLVTGRDKTTNQRMRMNPCVTYEGLHVQEWYIQLKI
jgi:hypothetical protein